MCTDSFWNLSAQTQIYFAADFNNQKCFWSHLISQYRYMLNDCHKLDTKNKVKLPRYNYLVSFKCPWMSLSVTTPKRTERF